MDGTPGSPALALVGAIGFLACMALAPLNILGATLWLLPLTAVHLWPREAHLGMSAVLLIVLGVFSDFWIGIPLGATASIALIWFAVVRPDLRDEDATQGGMWFTFAVGLALVIAATLIVFPSRSTSGLSSLLFDGLAALIAFPVVFHTIRFFRFITREPGNEAFP